MTEHQTINPKFCRIGTMLGSLVAALGALAAGAVAAFGLAEVLWATLGFAIVGSIAAGLGLAAAVGRFASGFGMATLCVGGTIAVAAGFAMLDLRSNLAGSPEIARLLMPWVGLQTLAAAAVIVSGGLAVLSRRPCSWGSIGKGVAFLVPTFGLLAAGIFILRRIEHDETGRVLALGVLLAGGAFVGTLFALGSHHLIRAFEMTADEPDVKAS